MYCYCVIFPLTRFKASYFDKENLICDGALYKTPEKMQTKGRGQRGKLLDVYTAYGIDIPEEYQSDVLKILLAQIED